MIKKKILFVASEFAPGMIPFATSIINTLAVDERFEVHCLCVCFGRYTYRGLITAKAHPLFVDYPVSRWLKLVYKFWPFDLIRKLKQMVTELSPDAVHYLTGDFALANYVSWYDCANCYYTVHDLEPHESVRKTFLKECFDRYVTLCNARMRNKIPHLTTSSHTQYLQLRRMYPSKKVLFTPFPTLVNEAIAEGTKPVVELEGIHNYLLFFGNVNVYKGVDLLVRAFLQLSLKDSFRLVIAGKGNTFNEMMHHPSIVRINRFIDDEEIGELFRNASIVVYPYRSATMSGVLSIAYYFHKRVLLSDIPFFKDNACCLATFFRNRDESDLAFRMEYIVNNPSIITSENKYQDIYSSAMLVNDYIKLYQS